MIELTGDEDFQSLLAKFLLTDEDELETIIEQLDLMILAAEHALHLLDSQTTH